MWKQETRAAHQNQKVTAKQAIPRVFWIICKICIEKKWPLVTANLHLAATKLLLNPKQDVNAIVEVQRLTR